MNGDLQPANPPREHARSDRSPTAPQWGWNFVALPPFNGRFSDQSERIAALHELAILKAELDKLAIEFDELRRVFAGPSLPVDPPL